MAHLLGSKACIDSLRVDIDDLQNVVHDIISRTGSIKCHSWKFPDKLATDLDMKELLERYQYGKHEVDNQVTHIVLFEIIIDRLLLVIHGSWRFLHDIQTKLLPNVIDASSTINHQTCLSVGLVVKKYWNKLLQIFATLQQHESHRKRSNLAISTTALRPPTSTITTEKHCQTVDTSFGPCPSCIKLQQHLRDYGDSMINLCETYNLPSSLAHHRCSTTTIPEWLSPDDITHWFESQSKDFDGLSKHLDYLNNTLTKTKTDLDSSVKHGKQQTETNRRFQQTINENKQSKKILQDAHEKQLSEMNKKYEQETSNLNEQVQLLSTQKMNIEQQFKEMNDQYALKGEQIEKLESTKTELKFLTENRIKSDDLIKTMEQDRIRLQTELDVLKRDLEERNRELQKERIRIENMIRQEEHSQSKQKTLTKSHEELSEECESLKKQVTELELERDELQKSLAVIHKQTQISSDTVKVQSLMETNNQVLQEVASLKTNIEQLHQQMNEREQMVSKYSDLNGNNPMPSKSDHLIHDVQDHLRTNELRIDLLRKENDSLKSSLENCLLKHNNSNLSRITEERCDEVKDQSQRRYSFGSEIVTPKPKQAPLWLLNTEILEQQQAFTETRPVTTINSVPDHGENNYTGSRWIRSDSDVHIQTMPQQHIHSEPTPSTRIHSTDLVFTTDSRPPSVTRSSRTINSKVRPTTAINRPSPVDHSRRDTSLRKTSKNISTAKTQRLSLNILHRCTTCNRTYDDKRNYDMHKLYCRT